MQASTSENTINRLTQALAWTVAIYPLVRLVVLGMQDALSANPVEFVTRSLGTWALVFLCLKLTMTPMRWITQQTVWIRRRRFLGLTAFSYAVMHLLVWAWLDNQWVLEDMIKDVLKRPYLTFGAAALFLMVPLALTSNRWSIKKLGPRWGQLHRLVYLIVILGLIHLYFHKAGKHDFAKVWTYGSVVFVLLGFRLKRIIR